MKDATGSNAEGVEFRAVTAYEAGTVFSLLAESFAGLWNAELEERMRGFDREVFENPDTVGACVFVTEVDGQVVGMASYDPRQGPAVGVIGYNCVRPTLQGKGYGKKQIEEILRRLKARGFKKVVVTTGGRSVF